MSKIAGMDWWVRDPRFTFTMEDLMEEGKSYHDTGAADLEELPAAEAKAKSQDQLVLEYLVRRHPHNADAEMVHQDVLPQSPRTSVSRALSNLKNLGLIEMTGRKVFGRYGSKINTWRYRPPSEPPQRELKFPEVS